MRGLITLLTGVVLLAAVAAGWAADAGVGAGTSPARVRCLDCHVSLPLRAARLAFHGDTADLCESCHRDFPCGAGQDKVGGGLGHPVGIVPSMPVPADMPLDREGKVTCITCHPYHDLHGGRKKGGRRGVLRRANGAIFCYACHQRLE